MKNSILKNLHLIIIMYGAFTLFELYEAKTAEIEQAASLVPTIEAKINRAKKKIKEIQSFKKNLSKSKERVQEVVKQIEKVQRQLPTNVNDVEVQQIIGKIGKDLKMIDIEQSPGKESNEGFYYAKEYNFNSKGTFLQAIVFFENLERQERILNVKNFELDLAKDQKRSRFQILDMKTVIESFRYNENSKINSGVEDIENQFKVN